MSAMEQQTEPTEEEKKALEVLQLPTWCAKVFCFFLFVSQLNMFFSPGRAFEGGGGQETGKEAEEDAQSWREAGQVIKRIAWIMNEYKYKFMKYNRFGQDNWSACGGGGHCRRGVVIKSFHSDADFMYTDATSREKSNRSEQQRWWAAAAADHTMQQRRSRAMIRLLNFSPGDQGWTIGQ